MTDTDLVAGAVQELYGSPADSFVAIRTSWVKRAKAAKDKDAAAAIAELRKPTRSAEILNQLARSEPTAVDDLLRLGADLRRAQRTADAPLLRELTARRRALVGDLLRLAGRTGPLSPAVRDEITATLGAALVDDAVATGLRTGTLSKPGSWDGFGPDVSVQLTVVRSVDAPDRADTAPTSPSADAAATDSADDGAAADEPSARPDLRLVSTPTSVPGSMGSPVAGEPTTADGRRSRSATTGHPDLDPWDVGPEPAADPEERVPPPPAPQTLAERSPVPQDTGPEIGGTIGAASADASDSDPAADDRDEVELSDRQLKDRARAIARQQVREEEHTRRVAARADLDALEERRAAQRAERAAQARAEAQRRLDQATAALRVATESLDDLDGEVARLTRQLDHLRQDREDQADLTDRAERAVARARAELDRLTD